MGFGRRRGYWPLYGPNAIWDYVLWASRLVNVIRCFLER